MEKLCRSCGTMVSTKECAPLRNLVMQRHKAPCGATCGAGCVNGEGYTYDEKTHNAPWEGHPETDGHYHGECPNGCFKDCCNPPGNLCGPTCQLCFACRKCDHVHPLQDACAPDRLEM